MTTLIGQHRPSATGEKLTAAQRATVWASFLGWTLDAFDFFLLVFVLKDIAAEFHTSVRAVSFAIVLTLALRPVGAFLFGLLADRYGRRPALMIDICCFSALELASAFAPSLVVLLIFRALFGIAMGGEWGVGASLALESIPPSRRGLISGLLQEGYAVGYLLAALVYGTLYAALGWRGMFAIGVLPALLVVFIRLQVPESPAFANSRSVPRPNGRQLWRLLWTERRRFLFAVALMTCFTFFSHGTQDLYPTFLESQPGFAPRAVGIVAVIYNLGALLGGLCFGALSERIGRRRAIASAALLALPMIPLWAFGRGAVALAFGAFTLQFMVQGAWGVVPAHLNELAPAALRGTFPGVTYQLGNLIAASNTVLQTGLAERLGNRLGLALALTTATVALALATLAWFGPEARGVSFQPQAPRPTSGIG